MSLKSALVNANHISTDNGILVISEIGPDLTKSISYSCFLRDIHLVHPQYGPGVVHWFIEGKWECDFDYTTRSHTLSTKQLINCIN